MRPRFLFGLAYERKDIVFRFIIEYKQYTATVCFLFSLSALSPIHLFSLKKRWMLPRHIWLHIIYIYWMDDGTDGWMDGKSFMIMTSFMIIRPDEGTDDGTDDGMNR